MKVITCQKPGAFTLNDQPMPTLGQEESLIKIKRVGICGTDLHAYAGNQAFFDYPRVLGHELSGEVVAANGLISGCKEGDEVVIIPYLHCGHCRACLQGRTNCCSTLEVLGVHIDGGMSEFIAVPNDLLLPAKGLTLEEMAIVEPLCIGTHAVNRVPLQKGDWVAVSGCGPIGVGIIWAAQQEGARVIALDIEEHRLAFVKEKLGVSEVLNAHEDPIGKIGEMTNGEMVSVAFDATGAKVPMEQGVDYVGSGGYYVLVGLNKGKLAFHHPDLHRKELAIVCSRNATKADFNLVISRLQDKSFPAEDYITHRVPADEILRSFDYWRNPVNQVMKAMTEW
ncbi:MAG: zinc-binding alcohol dehydrogenase family protein [Saprospiraceae bacterium]|nr:zinc-binding alcohol dehydrogenase family protein [Saprospiraceae bacterium]